MNTSIKNIIFIAVGALVASCSNYGYISENDVYMQAPTEMNLEEDENDITSFNAFKARQKGAFTDEYTDPRLNNRMRFNQFMIINAYNPYGSSYGMYNRPIGFHGMGWNDPYYNSNFYTGIGMSYGIGYGMGGYGYNGMYGNSFYSPYGFHNPYYAGYGYNPYYHGGYGGYYGGGYYGGGSNNTGAGHQQTVYYGQRRSLSSSSKRSSQYSSQQFKKSTSPNSSAMNYDVNNQTLGNSRRNVKRKYAGGNEYSTYSNKNGTFTHNGVPVKSGQKNSYQHNSNSAHRRAVNKSYTPTSSARRSGVVQQSSRRSGVTAPSNHRGASSTTRSRSNVRQTRSAQPKSNATRSTRISSPQRSSSPRSTSPSSGSSRRSSGSSSSSGRR